MLDMSAKIFMPRTTPAIKVDAVRGFANKKSEVILAGDNYDEAYAGDSLIAYVPLARRKPKLVPP